MITILPDTEGKALVAEASEKLTTKDYEEVFLPKLDELIHQYGKIRMAFYLDDSFAGWEPGAMWDDAKYGLAHRKDFERIAIVGGPRWVEWMTKLGAHFMPAEVRTFAKPALPEAIKWVKEAA